MTCSTQLIFYVILIIGKIHTGPTTIDNVDYEADTTTPVTYGDDIDVNLPYAWGGHKVPKAIVKKWKEWLKNYYVQMEKDKLNTDEQKDPSWPWTWLGMEGGHKALPQPPPWAYEPMNARLPQYCYLRPSYGSCSEKEELRYAYNPYTHKCIKFKYGGCSGNQNNFPDLAKCYGMCIRYWPKG